MPRLSALVVAHAILHESEPQAVKISREQILYVPRRRSKVFFEIRPRRKARTQSLWWRTSASSACARPPDASSARMPPTRASNGPSRAPEMPRRHAAGNNIDKAAIAAASKAPRSPQRPPSWLADAPTLKMIFVCGRWGLVRDGDRQGVAARAAKAAIAQVPWVEHRGAHRAAHKQAGSRRASPKLGAPQSAGRPAAFSDVCQKGVLLKTFWLRWSMRMATAR